MCAQNPKRAQTIILCSSARASFAGGADQRPDHRGGGRTGRGRFAGSGRNFRASRALQAVAEQGSQPFGRLHGAVEEKRGTRPHRRSIYGNVVATVSEFQVHRVDRTGATLCRGS